MTEKPERLLSMLAQSPQLHWFFLSVDTHAMTTYNAFNKSQGVGLVTVLYGMFVCLQVYISMWWARDVFVSETEVKNAYMITKTTLIFV